MKNRFRLAITALTILIVAACLFVSCNDDVITHKDNGNSYSEVLESNGAFVFKGKNYGTLQEAIDAAAKASTAKAINSEAEAILVTGNVKSRGITIPAETEIVINLKGFEIQFFDVETSAITVGEDATFIVSNGTLSMSDKKEGLVVISAGSKAEVALGAGLNIKANGQTAILLDGSVAEMAENVVVEGATVAESGSTLIIYNSLSDVRMNGVRLYIFESGSAVVTEISGDDNKVFVSPTGTIIDQSGEGKIKPADIKDSVCYIVRKGEVITFGSLKEALVSVEDGDEVYFFGEETEDAYIDLEKSATIKLMAQSTRTNNIKLANGVTLTIDVVSSNLEVSKIFTGSITGGSSVVLNKDVRLVGSIKGTGSLTASSAIITGSVDAGEVVGNGSIFYGDIIADGNVTLAGSEFVSTTIDQVTTYLNVTSEGGNIEITDSVGTIGKVETKSTKSDFGSVKIDNSGFEEAPDYCLAVGEIKANGGITLVGLDEEDYSVLRVTGSVSGNDITAKYCTFDSQGESKSINGNTVMVEHSHFVYDLDNDAKYYSITTTGEDPSETVPSLSISLSYGRVGDLRAEGGSVYVEGVYDQESDQKLEVGDIGAYDAEETPKYFDVTIAVVTTGSITADNLDTTVATVNGTVNLRRELNSSISSFFGAIDAGEVVGNGSIFYGDIIADGNVTLAGSEFVSTTIDQVTTYLNVTSEGGNIEITDSVGTIGKVETKSTKSDSGSVTIDNSGFEEAPDYSLAVGEIKANGGITLVGLDEDYSVLRVTGPVSGNDITAKYCTFDSQGESKSINGNTVMVEHSHFVYDLDNDAKYYSITTTGKDPSETVPSLSISLSYGRVGDLRAEGGSVYVEGVYDQESDQKLEVGDIGAYDAEETPKYFDVTIAVVTTGSITADNLDTAEAKVIGTVNLRGKLDSVESEFTPETEDDCILADEIVDDGGVFDGEFTITAVKSIVFEDSKFNASPDVTSAKGSIKMTNVTGIVGDITAAVSVEIDDSGTEHDFTTGVIWAKGGSVCVEGAGSNQLTVTAIKAHVDEEIPETFYDVTIAKVTTGSITANNLDTTEATVNGDVVLTGYMKSTGSTFYGAVSANKTVDDNGSTFTKNISAVGDITITSSTFASASEPASYPAIESTAGSIVLTKVSGQTSTLTASAEGKNITINNALATATLITGAIKAGDAVVVKGSLIGDVIHYVTVGGTVDAVSLDVTYAIVDDKVTLDGGNLISNYSVFTVNADVFSANVVDVKNSTVKGDISATDYIVFENTVFEIAPVITSESGYIEMTNSTGEVGDLTASGKEQDVTINNSKAGETLTTGKIKAGNVVSVTGAILYRVSVTGEVNGATVEASNANFSSTIRATEGDVTLASARIVESANVRANIEAINGNTRLTRVTGTAGNLWARKGNVTIDNTQIYSGYLTTGAIAARDSVSVKGRNISSTVTVDGIVYGSTLDAVYTVFSGAITTTAGDVTLADSTFNNNHDVVAKAGNINMTRIIGSVGNLTAANVTIDNSEVGYNLYTGSITADVAVTVTGVNLNDKCVNITGKVSAVTMDALYVYVTSDGSIDISGDLNSSDSIFAGSVSAATVTDERSSFTGDAIFAKTGNVTLTGSKISVSAVTSANGSILMTNVANVPADNIVAAGALTASNVTIDNAQAKATFEAGNIKAVGGAVTLTGNLTYRLRVAGVTGATLNATYTTVTGAVDLTGELNSADATFNGSVSATVVTDERSTFGGASITAKVGNVTLTGSSFATESTSQKNVISDAGSIEMTNVTGTAGALTASADGSEITIINSNSQIYAPLTTGKLTASYVTVNNVLAGATLTTGAIEADASVTVAGGNSTDKCVIITGKVSGVTMDAVYADVTSTGSVDISGDLNSSDSIFAGPVSAATVTDERSSFTGSEIVAKTGDVTLTGSKISVSNVTSANGSILMTNVANVPADNIVAAGALTASNVTIDNAQAKAEFTTGAIEAVGGAVTLTGNLNYGLSVGSVTGLTLDATHATVDGAVTLDGELTSEDSEFKSKISATVVTDNRSTFKGSISAKTGDVTLTGSGFAESTEVAPAITSANGNIVMTNVTKKAGALTASIVTVDNAQAKAEFTTGAIEAVGGAVTLTGNQTHGLGVGSVTGATLNATCTTVTGAVALTGELTSSDSVFNGSVNATVVTDNRSSFTGSEINAKAGDVTLTGSKISGSDVTSANGSILMTNVANATTTVAGNLTASDVTINNAQAKAAFGAGDIKAVGGAVTLTGYETSDGYGLRVGDVEGATLDTTYVGVYGYVGLTGELTSSNSVFYDEVSATAVTGERSYFSKDIVARAGDVKLTDSELHSTSGETAGATVDVTSLLGNITLTKVFGKADTLTAYDVTINNASATFPLETGVIEADGAVTVTGNSSKMVTVRKNSDVAGLSVKASSLDATYAIVEGKVNLTGELKSADSTFSGSVNATVVTDNRSTFTGTSSISITATEGDVILTGSKISGPNVTSESGTISMTNVTNVPAVTVIPAGTLTASSVKIDNVKVGGTLATGAITADDAVEVKGGNSTTKLVSVLGDIKGSTLVATYAALKGYIKTTTSVSVTNCTVGDGTENDYVNSPSIDIVGSTMNLDVLVADYVTINTPAAYSEVSSINTKELTVTAEDSKLSVGYAAASRKITINGGTYRGFTFSGSNNSSTISSGKFHGIFEHVGTATLTITGGSFVKDPSLTSPQYQKLNSGKTIINGTYSNTYGWNLVFDNLSINDDFSQCVIQSGYFMAASVSQMKNIGDSILQTSESVSASKFVELRYTGSTIGSDTISLNGTNVKKAVVYFVDPTLTSGYLNFYYPDTVELRGGIGLNSSSSGEIWSYGRKLNDKNGDPIIWKEGTSARIYPYTDSSPYKYKWSN